jgi:hypothetical protein
MAWNITNYVERGVIDNRERDYLTGMIWLRGLDEPIRLDLVGNAQVDLAGRCLQFKNPCPQSTPADHRQLVGMQQGTVGEITAARKVQVPLVPFVDLDDEEAKKDPSLFHWANGFYLEWHCTRNGHLIIESTDFKLGIDSTPERTAPEAAEKPSSPAIPGTVGELLECVVEKAARTDRDTDDDEPQGMIEAEAEADLVDYNLIRDRIIARLNHEYDINAEVHNRIIAEERARLRRERGLPELKPGSSEADEAEMFWQHEMDATTAELLEADLALIEEEDRHPLVEQCQELSLRLNDDIYDGGWAPEHATTEHPLHEITNSLCSAAAKLAGALCCIDFWPNVPYPGSTLVRLKKARHCLADARDGLQAARQEKLAPLDWLDNSARALESVRQQVQTSINEIRNALSEYEDRWL